MVSFYINVKKTPNLFFVNELARYDDLEKRYKYLKMQGAVTAKK